MKKIGVTILLFDKDKILGVSRRHDHNDFGLPGGKVDPGETMWQAAVRELKEETGLNLIKGIPVYFREDGEYIAGVYLATKWEGSVNPQEGEGRAEWVDWDALIKGSFGQYNSELKSHLQDLRKEITAMLPPESYSDIVERINGMLKKDF